MRDEIARVARDADAEQKTSHALAFQNKDQVGTTQFGYSAQQGKVMMAQAFQNKEVGMMAGRKTLEINPNHAVVNDLLAKVKAEKGNVAAMDSAQVLSQTSLVESGYEIADPSALV